MLTARRNCSTHIGNTVKSNRRLNWLEGRRGVGWSGRKWGSGLVWEVAVVSWQWRHNCAMRLGLVGTTMRCPMSDTRWECSTLVHVHCSLPLVYPMTPVEVYIQVLAGFEFLVTMLALEILRERFIHVDVVVVVLHVACQAELLTTYRAHCQVYNNACRLLILLLHHSMLGCISMVVAVGHTLNKHSRGVTAIDWFVGHGRGGGAKLQCWAPPPVDPSKTPLTYLNAALSR